MDVDVGENLPVYENNNNTQFSGRKPFTAPVDDAHPFDLDSYILSYSGQSTSLAHFTLPLGNWCRYWYHKSGRTSVDRLIHIIATCPSIASQALQLAVKQIQTLRDPALYAAAVSTYEQLQTITDIPLPAASDIAPLDPKWLEETTKRNSLEKTKLEVELKTYANNMIKESQRVCVGTLFVFFFLLTLGV